MATYGELANKLSKKLGEYEKTLETSTEPTDKETALRSIKRTEQALELLIASQKGHPGAESPEGQGMQQQMMPQEPQMAYAQGGGYLPQYQQSGDDLYNTTMLDTTSIAPGSPDSSIAAENTLTNAAFPLLVEDLNKGDMDWKEARRYRETIDKVSDLPEELTADKTFLDTLAKVEGKPKKYMDLVRKAVPKEGFQSFSDFKGKLPEIRNVRKELGLTKDQVEILLKKGGVGWAARKMITPLLKQGGHLPQYQTAYSPISDSTIGARRTFDIPIQPYQAPIDSSGVNPYNLPSQPFYAQIPNQFPTAPSPLVFPPPGTTASTATKPTTAKPTTAASTPTTSQSKAEIKKKQQAMVDAGYDLGKTGPNKDGVDGSWGPKSKKAWTDYKIKDNEYWAGEAQKARNKNQQASGTMGPPTMEDQFPGITAEMEAANAAGNEAAARTTAKTETTPPGNERRNLNNMYSMMGLAPVLGNLWMGAQEKDYYPGYYSPQAPLDLGESEALLAKAEGAIDTPRFYDPREELVRAKQRESVRMRNAENAQGSARFALQNMATSKLADETGDILTKTQNINQGWNDPSRRAQQYLGLAGAYGNLESKRHGALQRGYDARTDELRRKWDLDARTDAVSRGYTGAGLSQMSQWAQIQQQMSNQQDMDELRTNQLAAMYGNYDWTGTEWTPKTTG